MSSIENKIREILKSETLEFKDSYKKDISRLIEKIDKDSWHNLQLIDESVVEAVKYEYAHFNPGNTEDVSVYMAYIPKFKKWIAFGKEYSRSFCETEAAYLDDPDTIELTIDEKENIFGPCELTENCFKKIAEAYNYKGSIMDIIKKSPSELKNKLKGGKK